MIYFDQVATTKLRTEVRTVSRDAYRCIHPWCGVWCGVVWCVVLCGVVCGLVCLFFDLFVVLVFVLLWQVGCVRSRRHLHWICCLCRSSWGEAGPTKMTCTLPHGVFVVAGCLRPLNLRHQGAGDQKKQRSSRCAPLRSPEDDVRRSFVS